MTVRDTGPNDAVHFWAPTFKWGISLANIADINRPADKISLPQQCGEHLLEQRRSVGVERTSVASCHFHAYTFRCSCINCCSVSVYTPLPPPSPVCPLRCTASSLRAISQLNIPAILSRNGLQ